MSGNNWDEQFFSVLNFEHEQLKELLSEIRESLSASDRTRNQLKDLMSRLSDLVERHFTHEERSDLMRKVLATAPRFVSQAETLLDNHESLLEDAEKLRLLVHSGVESPAWWTRIEADFDRFATRLANHEHVEEKVVQAARTDSIHEREF